VHLVKAALAQAVGRRRTKLAESHNAAVHSLLMAPPPAPTLQFANLFARQIHVALALKFQRMRLEEENCLQNSFFSLCRKAKKPRKQFAIIFRRTKAKQKIKLPAADFCDR
jgi:hypothetical protein